MCTIMNLHVFYINQKVFFQFPILIIGIFFLHMIVCVEVVVEGTVEVVGKSIS